MVEFWIVGGTVIVLAVIANQDRTATTTGGIAPYQTAVNGQASCRLIYGPTTSIGRIEPAEKRVRVADGHLLDRQILSAVDRPAAVIDGDAADECHAADRDRNERVVAAVIDIECAGAPRSHSRL